MLNQYIMDQLKENDHKLETFQAKLVSLEEESEQCKQLLNHLISGSDDISGFFSPRSGSDENKNRIKDLQNQLQEIRFQEKTVEQQIAACIDNEDRYQKMLLECRNDTAVFPNSDNTEELKEILDRVEHCISLLYTDKSRCKNEMINLKYYLKALISSKNVSRET